MILIFWIICFDNYVLFVLSIYIIEKIKKSVLIVKDIFHLYFILKNYTNLFKFKKYRTKNNMLFLIFSETHKYWKKLLNLC